MIKLLNVTHTTTGLARVNTRDGILGSSPGTGRPTDRGRPIRGHGATRPREPDQTSIHGTHRGLRPGAAMTGRTHDRKRPAVHTREKVLASRGPSTHVLGPAKGRTRGAWAPPSPSPKGGEGLFGWICVDNWLRRHRSFRTRLVARLSSGERLANFLAVMDWLVLELRT